MTTVIISAILAAVVAAIIWRLVKNKKQGKTNCGCGCEHCISQENCHKN